MSASFAKIIVQQAINKRTLIMSEQNTPMFLCLKFQCILGSNNIIENLKYIAILAITSVAPNKLARTTPIKNNKKYTVFSFENNPITITIKVCNSKFNEMLSLDPRKSCA